MDEFNVEGNDITQLPVSSLFLHVSVDFMSVFIRNISLQWAYVLLQMFLFIYFLLRHSIFELHRSITAEF